MTGEGGGVKVKHVFVGQLYRNSAVMNDIVDEINFYFNSFSQKFLHERKVKKLSFFIMIKFGIFKTAKLLI